MDPIDMELSDLMKELERDYSNMLSMETPSDRRGKGPRSGKGNMVPLSEVRRTKDTRMKK